MLPSNLGAAADPRFNGAFRMNLEGAINCSLLERSLREIAQRHESFRTVFRRVDSEILQVVLPQPTLTLAHVDLRELPQEKQDAEIDAICLHEAQTGFDLTKAPPLRITLLKLADSKSMLVLTIHQLICDGWSIGIFMEELAKTYTTLAAQHESSLKPLEFQFGDYVVWQQEMATQPEVLTQLDYWKNGLAGYTQLQLVPDYNTTAPSISSEIISELLPEETAQGVKQFAQAHGTTFFVVSMAACMALLHRYTGGNDIALRTPLAGRTRVEFEGLIGQFVNQVIVRSDVAENQSFTDLTEAVRERVWEALANQDIPFDTVVHEVAGQQADSNDLFLINFVCQKEYGRGGPSRFDLAGTPLTTLPSKSQGALYDLNFFLVEREVGWRVSLEYKTDLYSRETATSIHGHFLELLKQLTSNPQLKLSEVTLSPTEALVKRVAQVGDALSDNQSAELPAEEKHGIQAIPASFAQTRFWALSEVDPTNSAFHMPVSLKISGRLSVPTLEKSFRLLIERHETLRTSFSEIDGQLMQVIHDDAAFALNTIHVQGGTNLERATWLEGNIKTLLEQPFDLSVLPLFRIALYQLSADEHVLALSIHHSIADAWSIQVFQRELWTAYEGILKNASFQFEPLTLQYGDFSIWQRDTVDSEATKEHLDYWLKSLAGELPVLDFPTDRLPDQFATPKSSLETLLLPDELTQSLKQFAQANNTTLYVVTLAAFSLLLSRASDASDLIVGSPVVNRRIETEPLIGPFAGPVALRLGVQSDASLQETLTVVRDTTLEALGHTDIPFEQLLDKLSVRPINGRSSLFQFYFFCQPAFLQTRELQGLVVTPQATTSVGLPFEMQLAVIERKEGVRAQLEYNANLFDATTIKNWLAYYQRLLETLTASPNLKLSELPAPPYRSSKDLRAQHTDSHKLDTTSAPGDTSHAQAPYIDDALTKELTEFWGSALNLESISPYDNFFTLGGRSLVAARLIAKINKQYSLKLGLATFFNYPTIAQLASLIRGRLTPQTPSSIVAVQSTGTATPLFMVHGVGGNVLNFYDLAKSLGPQQPVYGVEAQSLQPSAVPLMKLEELAAYYVNEVRKIQPSGPYQFLGYSYGGFVAYEMARQLQLAGEEVALVGMLDTPVWRHAMREEERTVPRALRQLAAVWIPFFHRLRPFTPPEIFDALKSTILRTIYTFATASSTVIPSRLRSVYHINSFAAVNYVPKPFDGAITLLRASREKGPRDLGWGRFTSKPARIFEIPGAHLQVLSNENLPRVVKSLRECLD
jgi:thioesterase domain-containing protein/non-ribosomal peptide synthetase component F